jgi:mediator of RNA polymerase II transcription subunit 14
MRLNLTDYDSIPIHFKDYTIASGRATFKVAGEFEVDLTIADENPESQFWFIDFRFIFTPSVSTLSPHIKFHIESKVNEALLKDGLLGCYNFLHELVLTHKISEFRRQSSELARSKWIHTLGVEPLNRSLSVQYWKGRSKDYPRSWFIMGVGGPRRKTNLPKSKATSHLYLRWFRDGKEVENPDIAFDSANISAETLLRTVVGKHSAYILESMHSKLRAGALYANRDLGLSLQISDTDPAESVLKVQLTNEDVLSIQIQPITGRFVLSPASQIMGQLENTLNTECSNPVANGHTLIEHLRSIVIVESIKSRAVTVGWEVARNPGFSSPSLKDELKEAFKGRLAKDYKQILWLRRPAWDGEWYLAVFSGISGEQWVLLRTYVSPKLQMTIYLLFYSTRAPNTNTTPQPPNSRNPNFDPNLKISTHIILPIKAASITPTYSFLSSLNIFTAGLVSHYANLLALHQRRCGYMLRQRNPSKAIAFPSVYIRILDILPSARKDWIRNAMRLTFQGLEIVPPRPKELDTLSLPPSQLQAPEPPLIGRQPPFNASQTRSSREENTVMIAEARMVIPLAKGISNINERVDQDIAFDSRTGSFAFRLRCKVGQSVIDKLLQVAARVERLVDFVQVLQKHEQAKLLSCKLVSLGKITFTYGSGSSTADKETMDIDGGVEIHKATVDFTAVENGMGLVLGKDNPHLRIVDQLTRILNSSEGLDGVATLLPQTLPVLRGLEIIEVGWTPSPFCEHGEVFINVRAADWYIIRYNIRQLALQNSNAQPTTRKIMFDVRMRQRRGEPWWYIKRSDNSRAKEGDTLDEALKPLWASSGPGWRGMRVSGVAQASGVQDLLEKVDEVVRTFAMTEETVGESIAAQVQAATTPRPPQAPNSRQPQQMQQQQRQLQTPNQIQSQGRSSQVKREIVEID